MAQTLTIRTPNDMHAHVRDGEMLRAVLPYTARDFGRAIIMPNLSPAVRTVADAAAYRDRILRAIPDDMTFDPLMTLYLTEETSPETIAEAKKSGFIHAFKNYPNGATTNSSEGVRDLRNATAQLDALQEHAMPLLLHGEITVGKDGRSVDPFDRERLFIEEVMPWLLDEYPSLPLVLEHITSEDAADFIDVNGGDMLAATITPHHLVADRRALFEGGLNPHFYCLPILKTESDLEALRALATAGYTFVFAGTDTAPHPGHAKERPCGCAAGCFVAPVALAMYAEVFEEENALDKLEGFLSEHGADWYGLPRNSGTITLERSDEPWAPDEPVWTGFHTKLERQSLGEAAYIRDAVRPFGMHTDPTKSMKWHWRVKR